MKIHLVTVFCILIIQASILLAQVSEVRGSISICQTDIFYSKKVKVKNTIEYYLENGIIYIQEYYSNEKLQSESYWVNDIIPVYEITLYHRDGRIKKVIDKSVGKYDLCYILQAIKINPKLKQKKVFISLSSNLDASSRKKWHVTYDLQADEHGETAEGIGYDPQTGISFNAPHGFETMPDRSKGPDPQQRPGYPGGFEKMTIDLRNRLSIPRDSLINERAIVTFEANTQGVISNVHVQGNITEYIKSSILREMKKMPNLTPSANTTGFVFGQKPYTFALIVPLRIFE
ncbi:hypothetical protein [Limibacterium fermenti]|uniref:hypothetical protein n=1 Tax=Limibacterium fermenti TaxID=3229863 RepID=UPI003A70B770